MKVENTKAQMRKGILEMCILSIISEKEIYTSDIIKRLEASELIVKEGTVYPLLTRLKNTGLLSYVWKESSTGPPRKYYEITAEGTLVLGELHTTWKALTAAVNKSIKSTSSTKAKPKASAKK